MLTGPSIVWFRKVNIFWKYSVYIPEKIFKIFHEISALEYFLNIRNLFHTRNFSENFKYSETSRYQKILNILNLGQKVLEIFKYSDYFSEHFPF